MKAILRKTSYSRNTFKLGYSNFFNYKYYLQHMSSYYTEKYIWIVPRAASLPHWSSLTRVFKTDIWVCLTVCLILVSLTLKYLDYLKRTETVNYVMNAWAVILNISVNGIPHHIHFQMLFFSWVLFSICITNVFQVLMTSYYIDPGRRHQINTIDELDKSDLILIIPVDAVLVGFSMLYESQRATILLFDEHVQLIELCFRNSNVAGLTSEETFVHFSRLCFKNMSPAFYKITDGVAGIHRTLGLSARSLFVPFVNQITTRLVESGIVDKTFSDFLDPSGWTRAVTLGKSDTSGCEPLTLFHMTSSFLYLIVGYILSTCVFIAEILVCKFSGTRVVSRSVFYLK
ncbi:hypothetical protein L9F63_016456 [Diploptera punctata]|uniref:Ionotropic glutamate receptor C-terminal domain-containing protein n=1 Tax=Diploptera punctata TaxID=6984 RepID=A0AAD8A1R8_DIPPU|nr:hypothetical protein L9F63_016456 [Diploptera punctata]